MDLNGWLNFLAQSTLLFVLCWVAVAVVTGLALALPAGVPPWASALIATLLPVVGTLVLLVLVVIRLARRPPPDLAPAVGPHPAQPIGAYQPADSGAGASFGGGVAASSFGGAAGSSPFGGGAAGPWSGSFGPSSPFDGGPVVSPFDAGNVGPFGFAPGTPAVGAAPPVPTVAPPGAPRLVFALGRGRNRSRPPSVLRLIGLVVLAVATVALAASLLVSWFTFDSRIVPPLRVWAWGTGLDVALVSTLVLLVAAQVLAWWRPSRWAAVIAVTAGATWTFVAGSALALTVQVTALLDDVDAFSYSVGDALGAFGLQRNAGVMTLPEGVDLSAVGVPGRTVDLSTVDLAAPIPAATLELGPGWFIAVAVGAVVTLWAIVEVVRANRAASALADVR